MFYSELITILCFAYLLGSINCAILICRAFGLPSPLETGSQNPGATNVLRIGGKKVALLTLLGDGLKGWLPLMLAHYWELSDFGLALTALTVVIGHIFPVFFDFKGGKGVATLLVSALGLQTTLGVMVLVSWALTAKISHYSSLASLVSVFVLLLLSPLFLEWTALFPLATLCGLVIWRHQDNIERLKAGTETKIALFSKQVQKT
jgi:glycerol-3-phosphate acyltransferase PlsY